MVSCLHIQHKSSLPFHVVNTSYFDIIPFLSDIMCFCSNGGHNVLLRSDAIRLCSVLRQSFISCWMLQTSSLSAIWRFPLPLIANEKKGKQNTWLGSSKMNIVPCSYTRSNPACGSICTDPVWERNRLILWYNLRVVNILCDHTVIALKT